MTQKLDKPSKIINFLSFIFPLFGFLLYFINKKKSPLKARSIGKWSLIGLIINLVFQLAVNFDPSHDYVSDFNNMFSDTISDRQVKNRLVDFIENNISDSNYELCLDGWSIININQQNTDTGYHSFFVGICIEPSNSNSFDSCVCNQYTYITNDNGESWSF